MFTLSCAKERVKDVAVAQQSVGELLQANIFDQMSSTSEPIRLSDADKNLELKQQVKEQAEAGPLLVLRISELSCSMCVDSALMNVKRFIEDHDLEDRVLFLTSYKRERDLILFRRLYQIDYPVYNIGENQITLPVESRNVPYMFVTDSTLLSRSLFIPERTFPKLTKRYLDFVKKRYLI